MGFIKPWVFFTIPEISKKAELSQCHEDQMVPEVFGIKVNVNLDMLLKFDGIALVLLRLVSTILGQNDAINQSQNRKVLKYDRGKRVNIIGRSKLHF